jgi:hypothetical protein
MTACRRRATALLPIPLSRADHVLPTPEEAAGAGPEPQLCCCPDSRKRVALYFSPADLVQRDRGARSELVRAFEDMFDSLGEARPGGGGPGDPRLMAGGPSDPMAQGAPVLRSISPSRSTPLR